MSDWKDPQVCDGCGVTLVEIRSGVDHQPDCEWHRQVNLPEAKRGWMAAIAAHPHDAMSNPDDIAEAEAACETCKWNREHGWERA